MKLQKISVSLRLNLILFLEGFTFVGLRSLANQEGTVIWDTRLELLYM